MRVKKTPHQHLWIIKRRFWERNPWFSSRVQECLEVQGQDPDFTSLWIQSQAAHHHVYSTVQYSTVLLNTHPDLNLDVQIQCKVWKKEFLNISKNVRLEILIFPEITLTYLLFQPENNYRNQKWFQKFFRKKRHFESWNPDLDPHKRKTISNLYEYAIMNADLWTTSESLLYIFSCSKSWNWRSLEVILPRILTKQLHLRRQEYIEWLSTYINIQECTCKRQNKIKILYNKLMTQGVKPGCRQMLKGSQLGKCLKQEQNTSRVITWSGTMSQTYLKL